MKLVVDSSIIIDHLRGGTIWNSIFNDIKKENAELFLPTIVIFEVFSGKSTKDKIIVSKINRLFKIFLKIELSEPIAKKAGELYRDNGSHIDPADYIIAASTLSIGATLITVNKKHFEQISNLSLYTV